MLDLKSLNRINKAEFKKLHPELQGKELDEAWKKFRKLQPLKLYNQYHKLTEPELDNITGFRSKDKNEYQPSGTYT